MADKLLNGAFGQTRYKDMGDGTFAPVVAIGGGSGQPAGTTLVSYEAQITTATTTVVTATTGYIESIVITVSTGGTTSAITIQDAQGTPLKLVNALVTTAASTTPTVVSLSTAIKMTGGISIVTTGSPAATVNVWINYYQ